MRYYKVADEFELTFNLCVRLLSSFNRQISFYSPKVDEIFYNIIPQLCCNLTLWPLRLIVMAFFVPPPHRQRPSHPLKALAIGAIKTSTDQD